MIRRSFIASIAAFLSAPFLPSCQKEEPKPEQWTKIGLIYDPRSTPIVKFYVDGEEVETSNQFSVTPNHPRGFTMRTGVNKYRVSDTQWYASSRVKDGLQIWEARGKNFRVEPCRP